MPDPVLDHLLDKAEQATVAAVQAQAEVRAYLARIPEPDELVPLKVAADVWKITDGAALMRARRHTGVKRNGRWFVPRSALGC